MNIPITSIVGFLGLASLAIGVFLFLAGLEVFKITQITVMPGKKTWGIGLIFTAAGVVLLMPELLKSSQPPLNENISQTSSPLATLIPGTMLPPSIYVPDPLGDDVLAFARTVSFDSDPEGSLQSIGGSWESEWNRQGGIWVRGTATVIISTDNWIYVVQRDNIGGDYVIKAQVIDDRLVGRYVNVNKESDSTPWVGIMVDGNRIEGKWESGSWNFTRYP